MSAAKPPAKGNLLRGYLRAAHTHTTRRIQQQSVEFHSQIEKAFSPAEDYEYGIYEDDEVENQPILAPGEEDYDETCYSAPDLVASINNSEYSLSMFHDALYTTGIIGEAAI